MSEMDKGRRVFPQLKGRHLKWAAYGLLLIFTAIVQSLPQFPPAVFGVRPLLMVPVTVGIAMFEGPFEGALAGAAGGLLWDLFADRLLGFNALLLLALCCFCGLMSQLYIRNNLLSTALATAAVLIVRGAVDWFFYDVLFQPTEWLYSLLHLVLPSMAYTMAVTPLIFWGVSAVSRALRRSL